MGFSIMGFSIMRFSEKHYLYEIRKRFGIRTRHFGDCKIYRANKPFCDCGLLHDLQHIGFDLAKIIYTPYEKDLAKEEGAKKLTAKERKETEQILEDVFGSIPKPTLIEIKYRYDEMKKLIRDAYGIYRVPNMKRRLDYHLKKKYEDYCSS